MDKLAIQLEAVDALVAKFRERWEFEEDDNKMIEDFKASLAAAAPTSGKKEKKPKDANKPKRPPSAYNKFVSEKWDELTAAGFKGQDLIREAARLWNDAKAAAAAAPSTSTSDA